MSYKYKRLFMPNHPTSNKCGLIREHRYYAELKLGRLLKPEEVVHHIDEDKFNNDFDNLVVFKTASDHAAFHKGCKAVLDGDVYWCPDKQQKFKICPLCEQNLIYYQSKCCESCRRIKDRVVDRPSKETLFNMIKIYSFVDIGKSFGVSDNTIRKWCKFYGLPYRKSDLKLL